MRRAGRVVAEMHACIRAAIRPGVTTGELDQIGRDVIERRGARSNFLGYGHPPSPGDLRVAERRHRPRHPGPRPARGGRHRLDRLRRHRRGLARRRRLHRRRGADRARGAAPHRGHRGSLAAGIAAMQPGRPAVRHRRRRPGAWPRPPGSPWCGSTPATASAWPCTRSPTSRTGATRQGPQAGAGPDLRRRADGRAPAGPAPGSSTTQWTVVTRDGRLAPTPSTPSPSPTTARRSSPVRDRGR